MTADWQPIETAPKDGTAVLACARHALTPFVARWREHGLDRDDDELGWLTLSGVRVTSVYGAPMTHWMPLPELPDHD